MESTFAADSTGFSTCRFDRWYDHKWGRPKSKRKWLKAHVMAGTNTNVVTSVEITQATSMTRRCCLGYSTTLPGASRWPR